jgi:nicotinamidase-related amidase
MNDALLIIDVQQALLDEIGPARAGELLGTLVPLLDRARSTGLPVVFVRHDGSPGELIPGTPDWEIARDIAPRADEPIVDKRFGNAFQETNLTDVLAKLDAKNLIAAGMQTDFCVAKTVAGALERGYGVTVVQDAHATSTPNEPQVREAMHEDVRSRGGRVVPAADLFG